ncbi:MAG: hypothetical protein HYZ57_15085 [Acidobacteria bacterium]|nr:hypothetical protein [Acidobacteriota bacterium]
MTYKPRPWQLAAIMIGVCLAIVAGLLVFGHKGRLSSQDLAGYLPRPDSPRFFLDFAALRESGVLDRLVGSRIAEEPEYRKFVEGTGFDYRTDLDRVLGTVEGETVRLVVTGRFNWRRLIAYANGSGGNCHNGFCRVPGSTPKRAISFYPIRPDVMALAFAPDGYAASSIQRNGGPANLAVPAQPVWLFLPAAALKSAATLPQGTRLIARALEAAENVWLTMGPDGERFEIAMDVTCRTPEEAATMKAQLEGVTAMLQKLIARESQTPNPADLSGVLTAGKFERRDRRVLGRWPVERAFLYSLGGA